jgi:hypothetical protein
VNPYECKIFFVDGRFVWTETYYTLASSSGMAMQRLLALSVVRGGVMGETVKIAQLRTARLDPPGDVLVTGSNPPQFLGPAIHPTIAILVVLTSVPNSNDRTSSSHLYLRGLPTVFFAGQAVGGPAWTPFGLPQILVYFNALATLGFVIPFSTDTKDLSPIDTIVAYAADQANINGTAVDPTSLPPYLGRLLLLGDFTRLAADIDQTGSQRPKVKIAGFSWGGLQPSVKTTVNGVHDAISWASGGVVIQGKLPLTGNLSRNGYLFLPGKQYLPIASGSVIGVTKRSTGGRTKVHGITAPGKFPVVSPGTFSGSTTSLKPIFGTQVTPAIPPMFTITNALEMAITVFDGYFPAPPAQSHSIGIYQVLNYQNLWLVVVSGTSKRQDQFTGLSADIAAGLPSFLPDLFETSLIAAVQRWVPEYSNLLLAGHSLGGMVCQNAIDDLRSLGYTTNALLTMGTPFTGFSGGSIPTIRLIFRGDPVPYLTPLGLVVNPKTKPSFFKVLDDPTIPDTFVDRHSAYAVSQVMATLDVLGYALPAKPADRVTLQLGSPFRVIPKWYYPPPP